MDLLPYEDRALTTRRDAVVYRVRSSEAGADSSAFRSNSGRAARSHTADHANLFRKMEAPGFEPGMEVWQTYPVAKRCLPDLVEIRILSEQFDEFRRYDPFAQSRGFGSPQGQQRDNWGQARGVSELLLRDLRWHPKVVQQRRMDVAELMPRQSS